MRNNIYKREYIRFEWLNKYCDLYNLWFYNKSNIIRAPFEAALSLYLAELYVFFSNKFGIVRLDSNLVGIIFFPIIIAVIVCVLYSVIAIRSVLKSMEKIIKDFIMKKERIKKDILFNEIDTCFKKRMLGIHVLGAGLYIVFAIVFGIVLKSIYNIQDCSIIIHLGILGVVSGSLWNLYGLISDQRIDWRKILLVFKIEDKSIESVEVTKHVWELTKDIKIKKFKMWFLSILVQAIIILLICVFGFYVLSRLDVKPSSKVEFGMLDSVFVSAFFATLVAYLKMMYKLFFQMKSLKNEPEGVFLNLFDLVDKE